MSDQKSCSYEQLAKTMENFVDNMLMSALELYECFEKMGMFIKEANEFMDNLKAKKLSSTSKSNVVPIILFLSDKKLDLNKGKTTNDV